MLWVGLGVGVTVLGDTSPNLPQPKNKGGCGGVGMIIMIVVAVVATIFTAGAAAMAMAGTLSGAGFGTIMAAGGAALSGGAIGSAAALASISGVSGAGLMAAAAIGGAVGSIVSQGVGIAIGAQDHFSWKQVAASSIGSAVGAGVGGAIAGQGASQVILRAAITNAMTQGISVAAGLQDHFSWTGVAAAAVGSAVGQAANAAIGPAAQNAFGEGLGAKLVTGTMAGIASGAAVAVMRGGRVSMQQIAADSFGNALASGIVDQMQRGPEVVMPEAVAKEAENNPAVAALYRKTVENFRAGGIADDKAQELALRGFDLRNSADDTQALDAYKQDVLMSRGATADGAKAFLNHLGLLTTAEQAVPMATGDVGDTPGMAMDPVTVTGERGAGFSKVGRFLFDWQDELAAVGTASQKVGQWMDDNPMLGWGVMAVQAATTPLLFAGQTALEHSPIGEKLNALTGAAFEAASDFVDDQGAIGDKGKAALMTIGGISALSLAVGGLGMLRRTVGEASSFAKQLERRRIELNAGRDGGVDPHMVDPRVLAQQRLGQMEKRLTGMMNPGDTAHFLEKHGPQTTLAQQYARASTGGWPDPTSTKRYDASRFFNPEDMEVAIQKAVAQRQPGVDQVRIDMGKPVGEGFIKGSPANNVLPEYRQSNIVIVNFDAATSLPYTAFPALRLGVAKPTPNF